MITTFLCLSWKIWFVTVYASSYPLASLMIPPLESLVKNILSSNMMRQDSTAKPLQYVYFQHAFPPIRVLALLNDKRFTVRDRILVANYKAGLVVSIFHVYCP